MMKLYDRKKAATLLMGFVATVDQVRKMETTLLFIKICCRKKNHIVRMTVVFISLYNRKKTKQ